MRQQHVSKRDAEHFSSPLSDISKERSRLPKNALRVIQEERELWEVYQKETSIETDKQRETLAPKVVLVCEALEYMVNENIILLPRQQICVRGMLSNFARDNDIQTLTDLDDTFVLLLGLASYINSCKI